VCCDETLKIERNRATAAELLRFQYLTLKHVLRVALGSRIFTLSLTFDNLSVPEL